MTNIKHIITILVLLFTFISSNSAYAQVRRSVYSMFGIGQLIDHSFGTNKSLGGTGIAFQSGRSINYLNPASYLGMSPNSFNMELGIYGIYTKSQSENTSQTAADGNISYFSANAYLADWWGFSFGIVPYSSIDYQVILSDEIGGELTSFNKYYNGSGGLNRIYFGNSFSLYKGLAVGFNATAIFGPITQTEKTVDDDSFIEYELINQRTASGFYLDYGLQYSINHKNWAYTLGLIYGPGKFLKTTEKIEFTYNDITSELEENNEGDLYIPPKFGLGIAAKKGDNFRVGFDYEWKNWSNISFSDANFKTRNSNRFSTGLEYSPVKKSPWFKKLYYRFGANYKSSYLKIKNTPIDSKALTFGIGVPYGETSIFNMSFEYGEEGTFSNGLIKDKYMELYFNFSLHEFLSIKSEED